MKQKLLLFIFAPLLSEAQISIQDIHTPNAGDMKYVSVATIDQSIDYQTTGTNQTWDFSNLQAASQVTNEYKPVSQAGQLIQIVFGNFAPANYASTYYLPNNTLPFDNLPSQLPIQFENVNSFYKRTATKLNQVGYSMEVNGQEIPAKSDTIETKYHFPIEFGDQHMSRGYTKLNLNPIFDAIWIQHRKRETYVDGYGSITTPFGTFDALRIHHRIEETDSFYVSVNGFGFWLPIPVPVSHEYEWRSNTESEAILKISTSEIGGNENVTRIEYRDNQIIGINENTIALNVGPNPVKDHLNIQTNEPIEEINIYNLNGQKVLTPVSNHSNLQNISVEDLVSGTYLLEVKTSKGKSTSKFIK